MAICFRLPKPAHRAGINVFVVPVEERFEVLNPAILKDKAWVHDNAEIIRPEFSTLQFVRNYQEKNLEASESEQVVLCRAKSSDRQSLACISAQFMTHPIF